MAARTMKLRTRYMLVTSGLILVTILTSLSTYIYLSNTQSERLKTKLQQQSTHTYTSEIVKRGTQLSDYLSEALFDALYSYNLEATWYLLQPILTDGEISRAIVFDKHGNIFHDGTPEIASFGQPFPDQDVVRRVIENGEQLQDISRRRLYITTPIEVSGMIIGGVRLELSTARMAIDIAETTNIVERLHDKSTQALLTSAVVSTVVILAIAGGLVFAFSVSLVRPIQHLTRHAEKLGQGSFEHIGEIKQLNRDDEIGGLANAIAKMAESIQQRTQEISYMAYHDALTGLPNRHQVMRLIRTRISKYPDKPFAIMFIDIDDFKLINDNFGHGTGDVLLCTLAKRLTSLIKLLELDGAMVSRISGDEFLLLLPLEKEICSIETAAEHVLSLLATPMTIESEELITSGSVGIASYPASGNNSEDLIKNADIAMYCAKAQGKNTYCVFTHEMAESVIYRNQIEKEMRRALLTPEQFELWYQPQFDLITGELIGAEALVRWRHPERGIIPPMDFIDIAEKTGLIVPIGEWLIHSACEQLAKWRECLNDNFHVAVNLSCKQLYNSQLSNFICSQLAAHDIDTKHFHVEITESILMQNEAGAEKTLETLSKNGINVWLDDFGTGYSSLSYLRRFTVSGIKIDRSFISNMEEDKRDQNLVQALLQMTKELDLEVVAEGIENAVQAELLQQFECQTGQGYHFGRPMPAEEFTKQFICQSCCTECSA
uniref:putative bifunctional diguanylate cyclase/phosphodiesterase n=1 Tax=Thaumasiovibrio occultus TaxID=1891184 RepID=UPI000B34AB58|nr:EAL domain-containing protein [Thaumasiovibrio occultus]